MADGHLSRVMDRVRRLIGADVHATSSDAHLLGRFQSSRDGEAFAVLLQRHGPMVQGVCRRVLGNEADADDVFQATFLLFARKADSIRQGTSLPAWLYRVAYRLALRARTDAVRRQQQERRAAIVFEPRESRDGWGDVRPVLDEELHRLPAKYRDSIVVRYLEGKSNEEAARHFGLPPGSMSWRLSRALDLLRERLARRGVLPVTAVLAALLAERAAPAAVSADLATATSQAGVLFASGEAAEGAAISVRVYLLVEGGLRAMFLKKLMTTAGVLFLVLAVGALGVMGYPRAGETTAVHAAAEAPPAPPKVDEGKASASRAVVQGLRWLATHQAEDGHWAGGGNDDVAGTSLGLLPFLLVGETHKVAGFDHVYAPKVGKGLRYLRDGQQEDGRFTGTMYGQALATWALCEAYRQTSDPALKGPAQRAVDFAVKAQHEGGGWRYAPNQPGDTSVTTWFILALNCGKQAGLKVPEKSLTAATTYLDSVAVKDGKGYTYIPNGGQATPTMTGAAVSTRLLLGWKADNPALTGSVKLLQDTPPRIDARNAYAYHWATRALKGVGGEAWKEWEPKMRKLLLDTQETGQGEDTGSWPTVGDPFGQAGGRVMITSLSLITLELCATDELTLAVVKPRILSADERAALWQELAGQDLFRVRQSMAQLTGDPKGSVASLREKLRPTPKPDGERIARLIADLDSNNFAQRRKAAEQIENEIEFAELPLRKLLDDGPSLELKQRVEQLLKKVEDKSPESLRLLRSVTVLERLGTPEARDLLKQLADGAPESWQTREAKAALGRLGKAAK